MSAVTDPAHIARMRPMKNYPRLIQAEELKFFA